MAAIGSRGHGDLLRSRNEVDACWLVLTRKQHEEVELQGDSLVGCGAPPEEEILVVVSG